MNIWSYLQLEEALPLQPTEYSPAAMLVSYSSFGNMKQYLLFILIYYSSFREEHNPHHMLPLPPM